MSKIVQYRVANCPICKQGYIEIVKEKDTGRLFVYCDECEAEWESPLDAIENRGGSRFKFGGTVEPTFEEIISQKWEKYLISGKD